MCRCRKDIFLLRCSLVLTVPSARAREGERKEKKFVGALSLSLSARLSNVYLTRLCLLSKEFRANTRLTLSRRRLPLVC